jgi:hypothetical protein
MDLKERIDADLRAAMKAGDKLRLGVVRMLKSAVQYKEVEPDARELDDSGVRAVVATLIKQRRDSVEQYRKGGREELAAQEEAEIGVLQGYLPAQLSEAELASLVDKAIAATGAQGAKDMGKVMKALLPEVAGKAEGKAVSGMVKKKLPS